MSRSKETLSPTLGCVAAGLAALHLFTAPAPALADPGKPSSISLQGHAASGGLRAEAMTLEKSGRWLGAVSAWRDLLRASAPGTEDYQTATARLHELSGLSWMTSVKSRVAKPLVVADAVVLFPHQVKYSDRMRDVVTAVDRATGNVLWTREDAIVVTVGGQPMAFVQNWEHVARIDLKTGGDLWSCPFPGQPARDTFNTPNRKLLGVDGGIAFVLGDTWPMAVDVATGKQLWGPDASALAGYRALVTAAGVAVWPGSERPASVPASAWKSAPLVMLDRATGLAIWKRSIVPGEPWVVASDDQRLYLSDPRLSSELAWTAVSLTTGETLWRQPQALARPSTLTVLPGVLMEQAAGSPLTRFMAQSTGKVVWQTERMSRCFAAQGIVLEESPAGPVVARDLVSGQMKWQIAQDDDLHVDSLTAQSDGSVFMSAYGLGALSGTEVPGAVAADPATGTITWRHRASDTPYEETMQTICVAGDYLLMERQMRIAKPKLADPTKGGLVSSIVALDTKQGNIAWGFWDLTPERDAAPVRVGNTLWLVGRDKEGGHTLYAFDLGKVGQLVQEGKRWWW